MMNPEGTILLLGGSGPAIAIAGVVEALVACLLGARSGGLRKGLAPVALATACAILATIPLVAEVLARRQPPTRLVIATIPFVALGLCLGLIKEVLRRERMGSASRGPGISE